MGAGNAPDNIGIQVVMASAAPPPVLEPQTGDPLPHRERRVCVGDVFLPNVCDAHVGDTDIVASSRSPMRSEARSHVPLTCSRFDQARFQHSEAGTRARFGETANSRFLTEARSQIEEQSRGERECLTRELLRSTESAYHHIPTIGSR